MERRRLPYASGKLAMTVVLPSSGLDQLEHSLDAAALQTILTASRAVPIVLLTMPRWKFGLAAQLQDLLTVLGMPTAFNHALADLRGMTGDERLYIKAVRHQAFISVDERGTEAAAATALVAEGQSAGPPPPVLNLNRPFLFVICDVETATPLFIGRVSDPTES